MNLPNGKLVMLSPRKKMNNIEDGIVNTTPDIITFQFRYDQVTDDTYIICDHTDAELHAIFNNYIQPQVVNNIPIFPNNIYFRYIDTIRNPSAITQPCGFYFNNYPGKIGVMMSDNIYLYYSFSENDNFGKIETAENEFLYNEQYEKWLPNKE